MTVATGRSSLRWRLTLLISVLLVSIGSAFAWTAYREMDRALRLQGSQRILAAASQLSDVLAQAGAARMAEGRRLANEPAIRAFATSGDEPEAAMGVLRAFGERNPTVAVILTLRGGPAETRLKEKNVTLVRAPAAVDVPDAGVEGLSPLQLKDGHPLYRTRTNVLSLSGAPAGTLTVERSLASGSGVGVIQRLMGSGAEIRLGNAAGDVWTDLSAPIDAPPAVTSATSPVFFIDRKGTRRLGNAVSVQGTPWRVWVDFSEASLLEPAHTLLRRMLPPTIVLVLVGAIAVGIVSSRLTKPLEEVANAADALAAGDFSRRVELVRKDEIGRLASAFNVMAGRVGESHHALEDRVQTRTRELAAINRELEAFSYSVSHDLRAPLRSIDGFSQALMEDCAGALGPHGEEHLTRIRRAAQHMGRLIDDLLKLARVTRAEMHREDVDVSAMTLTTLKTLTASDPARQVDVKIQPGVHAEADPRLLQIVMTNLLENAWKFTGKARRGVIEFGMRQNGHGPVYFVRDNGAGFDMAYASKLFGTFQRLHHVTDYPGTGVGLATAQRIVSRHGGRIWADGTVGAGATFSFTLHPEAEA